MAGKRRRRDGVTYSGFEPVRRLTPSEMEAARTKPKPTMRDVRRLIENNDDDYADAMRSLELVRVDLVEAVNEGLPPIRFLKGSADMVPQGKRVALAAPAKEGKSFGVQVLSIDMALAGVRVAVFDRENGTDVYGSRFEAITGARGFTAAQERTLQEHYLYVPFPSFNSNTGEAIALLGRLAALDLVIFDSQRMILADMGLAEADSDDFAQFMNLTIDPLFRDGVGCVILDNTGHDDKNRPRGSSSKLDLCDIILTARTRKPFSVAQIGEFGVRTELSRLGNVGSWSLTLGGGEVGCWRKDDESDLDVLMGFVRRAMAGAGRPMAAKRLMDELRAAGYSRKQTTLRKELKVLATSGEYPLRHVQGAGYVLDG